ANAFRFNGRSLRFTPVAEGYRVTAGPPEPEYEHGTRSNAYWVEPAEVDLPFDFPFFGKAYRKLYAFEFGVVMFELPPRVDYRAYADAFPRQPPLIAAFWHAAFGRRGAAPEPEGLFVNARFSDRVVLTWLRMMGAQIEGILNSYQVVLYRDGRIEIAYRDIQHPEGFVGLSRGPGRERALSVRLADPVLQAHSGSFYEEFHLPSYDVRKVARAFYRQSPDSFDALAIYETFSAHHPAVSSHWPVKNDVRGIGRELHDQTAELASGGRLQSVLLLNRLEFLGPTENTGMLGHEFGHRWLAYVAFMDGGRKSYDLLDGAPGSHWCFYFDTRAGTEAQGRPVHSFLMGTVWEPQPDGRFRARGSPGGYSRLDLYLMGLLPPDSVPDFFYVADRPDQGPACGITGTSPTAGRKKVVTIQQIIAAEGPRAPDVTRSPQQFRTGFILLVPPGNPPTADQLAKLDRLRRNWERDFSAYTGGRATMDTRLRWDAPVPDEPRDTGGRAVADAAAGAFRLRAEAKRFVLQWTSGAGTRRFAIPRSWLIPPRQEAPERDGYVSSFEYDTAVTAFPIGNGAIGLHVSSYAIAREGSSRAAAGRDVFLVFEPDSGAVRPGLATLRITKERVRAVGCPLARTSHFLTADVDGDGLLDIGKIDERLYCVEVFPGGRPRIVGPLYDQSAVSWFVFRAGRWQHDPRYSGRMPAQREELPLLGLALTPVDVMAYATWRTYDPAKWGDAATRPETLFVPAYRRRLVEREGP
ncbi:MAG: hypothetical protein ACRELA_05945, partial [Candidatus Rokuibacteriota bacterium]